MKLRIFTILSLLSLLGCGISSSDQGSKNPADDRASCAAFKKELSRRGMGDSEGLIWALSDDGTRFYNENCR